MGKRKIIMFILLLIAIPILKGEVEVPSTLSMKELTIMATEIVEYWYTNIENMIPSILGLF